VAGWGTPSAVVGPVIQHAVALLAWVQDCNLLDTCICALSATFSESGGAVISLDSRQLSNEWAPSNTRVDQELVTTLLLWYVKTKRSCLWSDV
jgi:hypothetical protein